MSEWIHPTDRADASPELQLLGRAWRASLAACGGYAENDRPVPEWAQQVLDAFARQHPGFDPAECMTPEWRAEKARAFSAAQESRQSARETRAAAVRKAAESRDWETLVALGVERTEITNLDLRVSLPAKNALVWGRGDRAVAVK